MDKFESIFRWIWGNLVAASVAAIVWAPVHYLIEGKFIGLEGFVNFFVYMFVVFTLIDIIVKAWKSWRNPA